MELNRTCAHVMTDGTTCGAYALRDSELCYWHHKAREAREERKRLNRSRRVKTTGIVLPLLEDANSIQFAIQMIAQAVADRRISRAESGALLYAVQLAITNLKNVQRPKKIYSLTGLVVPPDGDEHEDLFLDGMEIPKDCDPDFEHDEDDEEEEDENNDDEDDDSDEEEDEDDNTDEESSKDEDDDQPVNQEEIDYAINFFKKNRGRLKRLGVLPADMAG